MKMIRMLFFLSLFLVIAFFMIKNRRTFSDGAALETEVITEKQDITTDVEIDFERYMVDRPASLINSSIRKVDGLREYTDKNLFIPEDMKPIITLIRKGELTKALKELEKMEKMAEVGTIPWIHYFRGHILFMKMNFSRALDIFESFLEEFPEHELSSNVAEAVAYLEGM